MTMIKQEFDASGLPSLRPYLNYLLDNGVAEHVQVKWGRGYRWVIKIGGNTYSYKGGHEINKNLKKKIVSLYIERENKSLNNKSKNKEKNDYVRDLINELKELNAGQRDGVSLNLQHISVKQAIKLIQQNIQDKKLAFKLENNKYYFLNDHTLDKLMKGLIDENAVVQHKVDGGDDLVQTSVSDAEYASYFTDVKSLELIVVNTKKDKTKPGGGFFKYHHTTKFNLQQYGIFR